MSQSLKKQNLKIVTCSEAVKLRPLKAMAALFECGADRLESLEWMNTSEATAEAAESNLVIIDQSISLKPEDLKNLSKDFNYFIIRSKSNENHHLWLDAAYHLESIKGLAFSDAPSFLDDSNVQIALGAFVQKNPTRVIQETLGWGHLLAETGKLQSIFAILNQLDLDPQSCQYMMSFLNHFNQFYSSYNGTKLEQITSTKNCFYMASDGLWIITGVRFQTSEEKTFGTLYEIVKEGCNPSSHINIILSQVSENSYEIAWRFLLHDPSASSFLCSVTYIKQ